MYNCGATCWSHALSQCHADKLVPTPGLEAVTRFTRHMMQSTPTQCRNRITHWEISGGGQIEVDTQLLLIEITS